MEFNIRQKKVIEAKEKNIICLAPAGGGKTKTLIARIERLLREGCKPEKIVAITFTTMAAEEMKKRLGDLAIGMFIGTIHSYANSVCIMNGISTEQYTLEMDFDKIIKKANTIPIKKLPIIEHLLVDEFQDTGELEYTFIEKLPAKNRFYVGDERQSIYGFKACDDKFLRKCHASIDFTTYFLNQNYRCPPNILKYADKLIASMPKISIAAEAVKTKNGIIEECSFTEAIEEMEWSGDYGNWVILCRTNNELATAIEKLEEKKIPCLSFKKGDLDLVDMENMLREDKVKVLTIHGCMTADTIIPTSKGLMTIEEIVKQQDYTNLVFNGEYYDKVKNFIDNGIEKVYKITTKTGNSIKLTANHDVIVLNENGLIKKKVKDLNGTEEVLLKKGIEDYNKNNQIKLTQIDKKELHYNTIYYLTPRFLNEELAELIGMITADGTTNGKSIHYMKRYKECVERFVFLIKKCFNKDLILKPDPRNNNAWIAECNSTHINTFLYNNFDGIMNNNKFISSLIMKANENIQRAFLRGLFEDGAVALKKGSFDNITLTFKNKEMLVQLQALLFKLGIDASFTTRHYEDKLNPLNYCYIYSSGAEIFREKIGFISDFKQNRLNNFEKKYERKNKSLVFKNIFLNNRDKLHVKGKSGFWGNLKKNQGLTSGSFYDYYNLLSEEQQKIEDIVFIKNIFDNYLIESISSIQEDGEEATYCLTMEHENQFIQNGFLMGNSKGLEFKRVIVTGARTFNEEERRIAYVAATRAEQCLYWCPSICGRGKKNRPQNRDVADAGNVFKKFAPKNIMF